jgi:hypothetical protein
VPKQEEGVSLASGKTVVKSRRVAYTTRQVYEALGDFPCRSCGATIRRGTFFTRAMLEGGGGGVTHPLCRTCQPFAEPTGADIARADARKKPSRAAKVLRFPEGQEFQLTFKGEHKAESLPLMYGAEDWWNLARKAVRLMQGRGGRRLDGQDFDLAENILRRDRGITMLSAGEREARRLSRGGRTTLEIINSGQAIGSEVLC